MKTIRNTVEDLEPWLLEEFLHEAALDEENMITDKITSEGFDVLEELKESREFETRFYAARDRLADQFTSVGRDFQWPSREYDEDFHQDMRMLAVATIGEYWTPEYLQNVLHKIFL